jgi:hypothetical protein
MNRNDCRINSRFLPGMLVVLLLSAASPAQTVRPVISELGNPAKGRVEYVNDGLTPLNVVLEAKSFTVSETGEISYRPLDPNIHLKLSTTSFRLQPQQTYYVFYEASSPQSPTWFVIYAAISGFPFRTAEGMNVRIELPHTVYLLPKRSVEKQEIRIERAELNRAEKRSCWKWKMPATTSGACWKPNSCIPRRSRKRPASRFFRTASASSKLRWKKNRKAETCRWISSCNCKILKLRESCEPNSPSLLPMPLRANSARALLALLLAGSAVAQVFKVQGGTSTLLNAEGGSVEFKAPNYDGSVGLGFFEGHFEYGAEARRLFHGYTLLAGDDTVPFTLPTDVFDSSHYFSARGIGAIHKNSESCLYVFAGATSTWLGTGFFNAATSNDPVGILF